MTSAMLSDQSRLAVPDRRRAPGQDGYHERFSQEHAAEFIVYDLGPR